MVGLLLIAFVGCKGGADDSGANAERREVLSNLAQSVAIGQYQDLAERAATLSDAATGIL